MLFYLIFLTLLFGLFSIFFFYKEELYIIKLISLLSTGVVLILATILVFFDYLKYTYLSFSLIDLNIFNLDGIALLFFYLSCLLIFLCLIFIWEEKNFKEYSICLIAIELFLLIVFSATNLLVFYFFFEAILVPMFFIIGVWGSRERKIRAVYLFFFYTLLGSVLMLLAILYIYNISGTLNLDKLLTFQFTILEQKLLWIAFFISFASKIPLFPFHIWLPEAHVEAPTVGSVLLAGILLKLGVYGFIRFSLTLFPLASLFFSPFVYTLGTFGLILASMSAIRQTDIKRIIAYSSISHMNLVVLGIFSFNTIGLCGSVLQSISHGFVSAGMFFLVGILYSRYHSRLVFYYGGLVHTMPIYCIFFFLFTLANISLPGTSSFVGELLIFVGVYNFNIINCLHSALGVILCGSYSLWLANRILFGNLKVNYTLFFQDLNIRELFILNPLLVFVFIGGLYPVFFSSFIDLTMINLSFINL